MSENISFIFFTNENITFSKYAFYFINNSLYFITLYIIKELLIYFQITTHVLERKTEVKYPSKLKTWIFLFRLPK